MNFFKTLSSVSGGQFLTKQALSIVDKLMSCFEFTYEKPKPAAKPTGEGAQEQLLPPKDVEAQDRSVLIDHKFDPSTSPKDTTQKVKDFMKLLDMAINQGKLTRTQVRQILNDIRSGKAIEKQDIRLEAPKALEFPWVSTQLYQDLKAIRQNPNRDLGQALSAIWKALPSLGTFIGNLPENVQGLAQGGINVPFAVGKELIEALAHLCTDKTDPDIPRANLSDRFTSSLAIIVQSFIDGFRETPLTDSGKAGAKFFNNVMTELYMWSFLAAGLLYLNSRTVATAEADCPDTTVMSQIWEKMGTFAQALVDATDPSELWSVFRQAFTGANLPPLDSFALAHNITGNTTLSDAYDALTQDTGAQFSDAQKACYKASADDWYDLTPQQTVLAFEATKYLFFSGMAAFGSFQFIKSIRPHPDKHATDVCGAGTPEAAMLHRILADAGVEKTSLGQHITQGVESLDPKKGHLASRVESFMRSFNPEASQVFPDPIAHFGHLTSTSSLEEVRSACEVAQLYDPCGEPPAHLASRIHQKLSHLSEGPGEDGTTKKMVIYTLVLSSLGTTPSEYRELQCSVERFSRSGQPPLEYVSLFRTDNPLINRGLDWVVNYGYKSAAYVGEGIKAAAEFAAEKILPGDLSPIRNFGQQMIDMVSFSVLHKSQQHTTDLINLISDVAIHGDYFRSKCALEALSQIALTYKDLESPHLSALGNHALKKLEDIFKEVHKHGFCSNIRAWDLPHKYSVDAQYAAVDPEGAGKIADFFGGLEKFRNSTAILAYFVADDFADKIEDSLAKDEDKTAETQIKSSLTALILALGLSNTKPDAPKVPSPNDYDTLVLLGNSPLFAAAAETTA